MKNAVVISILTLLLMWNCENEITKVREDQTAPEILSTPEIMEITASTATIQWNTSEPCVVTVKYGFSSTLMDLAASSEEFRQQQEITLKDLDDDTLYFFKTLNYDVAENLVETSYDSFLTLKNVAAFLLNGWTAYENKDYNLAVEYFRDYVESDSINAEALTGLGWSWMKLEWYRESVTYFSEALDIEPEYYDAIGGICYASYLDSAYVSSVLYGEQMLELDTIDVLELDSLEFELYDPLENPYYIFEHDTSFNNLDVSAILAASYYKLGYYSDSQYQINYLYPENILHPHDSTSWEVEDSCYSDYNSALGAFTKKALEKYVGL